MEIHGDIYTIIKKANNNKIAKIVTGIVVSIIVNIYMDIKGNEFRQSLSENEIREKYPNLTIQEKNNITEFIEKIQNRTLDANDLREMQEIYANIEWKNDNNIYHKLFRKYKLKKSRRTYIRKRINSIYI